MQFTQLHTYEWIEPTQAELDQLSLLNPFLERRVRRAVDHELGERGFTRARTGPADFLVVAFVAGYEGDTTSTAYAQPAVVVPRGGVSLSVGFGFGALPYAGYPFGYPYYYGFPYSGFGYGWGAYPV